jgi:putative SOS response-associated peptidase YedK
MCGRFALDIDKEAFVGYYKTPQMVIEIAPHYNITPGSYIPVVYAKPPETAILMRWGLVPHWSREPKTKFSTINARAETAETSAVYREPFQNKRCLIPAIGFFEWKKLSDGTKQPYYIHLKSQKIFSFAGLYDIWKDAEGKEFWTCTIVTTEPNSKMQSIHDRMPVILPKNSEKLWLIGDIHQAKSLLLPYKNEIDMESYRISPRISNPLNDDKELLLPV